MNKLIIQTIFLLFITFVFSFSSDHIKTIQELRQLKTQTHAAENFSSPKEVSDAIFEISNKLYTLLEKVEKNKSSKSIKNMEFYRLTLEIISVCIMKVPSTYSLVQDFVLVYSKNNPKLIHQLIKDLPKAQSKSLQEALKNASQSSDTGNG